MIRTIANKETESIWEGRRSRRLPPDIQPRTLNLLKMIDVANTLSDLRNPPGNRLHALTGDRAGQHSVSINAQWRVCFIWRDGGAHDVEITDYH